MNYLLLGILFAMFCISYYCTGKDFFAPGTMLTLVFTFAYAMCIYRLKTLPYQLHSGTIWWVASTVLLSVVIGIFMHLLFSRVRFRPRNAATRSISLPVNVIIFAIVMLALVSQIVYVYRNSSGTGISSRLSNFRNAGYYDAEKNLPFVLRQLRNLVMSIIMVYSFDFLRNYKKYPTRKKIFHMAIMLLCLTETMVTAARFDALVCMIAVVFYFHLLRIQRMGTYRTYKLGFIIKIAVVTFSVLWIFYVLRLVLGRGVKWGFLDYTAHYVGDSFINLDLYFQHPPKASSIWGKETFYSLLNALQRLGILDIDPYVIHLEFRTMNGQDLGNVYTFIRSYYYDFGVVGVFILQGLVMLITSFGYEYTKKVRSNMAILIYGMMYFSIVLSFAAEQFFSMVFSFGFVIRIIMVIGLYYMFIAPVKLTVGRYKI